MNYPHAVTVRFWEHIEPLDRGTRYEDPLQSALERATAGELTGAGSQLNALGGIAFAEIELALADLEASVQLTKTVLEEASAPQGSEIRMNGDVLLEFGTLQCLAIYLDGVSLPDQVYAELDFEDVIKQIESTLNLPEASYRGAWTGPEETGLYFFGPDAEEMFARAESLLRQLPITQNARVVIRHGKDALQPRTARLPRH